MHFGRRHPSKWVYIYLRWGGGSKPKYYELDKCIRSKYQSSTNFDFNIPSFILVSQFADNICLATALTGLPTDHQIHQIHQRHPKVIQKSSNSHQKII